MLCEEKWKKRAMPYKEQVFSRNTNLRTILKILKYSLQYPLLFGSILVFVIITAFSHNLSTYMKKLIIDEGILTGNDTAFIHYLIIYGALLILIAVTIFLFLVCAGFLCERIQYDVRRRMFSHMLTLSFSFFDKTPAGWLLARMTTDTTRLAELGTWMTLDIVWAVTNLLFALSFMLLLNAVLTLFVLIAVPLLILSAVWFKRFILKAYRSLHSTNSELTGILHENITGVKIIKGLVREEKQLRDFAARSEQMYKSGFRAAWLSSMFIPVVQLISFGLIAAVLFCSGMKGMGLYTDSGKITVGIVQAFVGYIVFILWPVQEIARVFSEMQRSIAGAERVFAFWETKPEIRESGNAVAAPGFRGDVEFRKVDFYYEAAYPVITDFSLKVRARETVALVGPTGAGKTTIVNLLCRFLEPRRGQILIDGRDYTEYTLHSLHSRLGVILQTPHLFSGTIMENIRYGRLDATDEEVYAAARTACADEFIAKLPLGYQEEVGEYGNLLSAGQKQLISLSRALLVNPAFFIMDEATSSVDVMTEALIQKAMEEFRKRCTCFIIAHRLTTIRNADRILVIEKGQIKEEGTHRELIIKGGLYYRLYAEQFRLEKERAYLPGAKQPI